MQLHDRAKEATDGAARLWRRRRRTISLLPSLFTLGNALCGFVAVFFASRPADAALPWNWSPLTFAALFVFVGMLFDALDGRIARLTRQTSDLGTELDSMSDMVSFGLAPAFIMVQMAAGSQVPYFASGRADTYFGRLALVVGAIYVACTALRLARFNVESKSADVADHMYFKGLPSPGAAGTVCSLVLMHEHWRAAVDAALPMPMNLRASAMAMVAVTLLVAFAMVSRLRYVHLLNRYVRSRARFRTLAKIVVVGLLLAISPRETLALALVAYALSAPAAGLWRWVRGRTAASKPHGEAMQVKTQG